MGIEYQRGLRLAFDDVNARGGVERRALELVTYDDGEEPAIAEENTRTLIQEDKVFALIGYVGASTVKRCLPLALRAGLPMLAPLSGAEFLRQRPPALLWHLRPGYREELRLMAQAMATIGISRVAALAQSDEDGQAALQSLQQALAEAKLPPPAAVASVASDFLLSSDHREQELAQTSQRLLAAQPQAVAFLCNYRWTAVVLRQLRKNGYAASAYALSLANAAAIAPLLGPQAAGLLVTQVVPSPFDVSNPTVADYQKRLNLSSLTVAPEYVSLEGWLVGQAVAEALRRSLRRSQGREEFIRSLQSLSDHRIGTYRLAWDASRHQASAYRVLTMLDARGRPRT
jgi:branched-chain amino acid transport system substrate-binding protein